MDGRGLDYIALGIFIAVLITLLYAIIGIHDIPYEIAKKRKHPHQDAIHAAGWLSLFLLHTLWPFLWIWATLYRPERGWGMLSDNSEVPVSTQGNSTRELAALQARVTVLEQKLESALEQKPESPAEGA